MILWTYFGKTMISKANSWKTIDTIDMHWLNYGTMDILWDNYGTMVLWACSGENNDTIGVLWEIYDITNIRGMHWETMIP